MGNVITRFFKVLILGELVLAACSPPATAAPIASPAGAASESQAAPLNTQTAVCCTAAPPATAPSAATGETATAPATSALPAATANPSGPLVAGQWNSLFYDPRLGQVVMVNGGPEKGKPLGDPLELWRWDRSEWTLLSAAPDGPKWRNFAGAAFDSARKVLVIHGGVQSRGEPLDDTWEWDGQTWTRFSGPGPGHREGAGMVFDAARGKIVLFGGATGGSVIGGDTWVWDGRQWTSVLVDGPQPRFPNAMVYDDARKKVLLFGGHFIGDTGVQNYSDLWEWDGAAWGEITYEQPAPGNRLIAQMVFDSKRQRVLLFGGGDETFLSDVWAWDGQQWSQIVKSGAPERSGSGGAYDPARDRVVLFGGVERPGGRAVTNTWEWDGQIWRCVQGCQ